MPSDCKKINASQAWVKLSTKKLNYVGSEPYVFVPGINQDVAVRCLVGWDDGFQEPDEIEYGWTPEDKLSFINFFNELNQGPTGKAKFYWLDYG